MISTEIKKTLKAVCCWPTLISVVGIAALLSLGTWQMHRLQWKESLLQQLVDVLDKPSQPLETFIAENSQQPDEFRKITVSGHFDRELTLKWMARTHEGKPGYHLVVPFHLISGGTILVDRGWVPQKMTGLKSPDSQENITLMVRYGHIPSVFTPENSLDKHEIYSLQPKEIARELGLMTLLPYYGVMLEKTSDAYPIVSEPHFSLRNTHLSYAITWYVLALALAVIYVMYIRKRMFSLEPKEI